MWDILRWELNPPYRWKGWFLPGFLEELKEDKNHFFSLLLGLTPVTRRTKDKRGWGWHSRHYKAVQGYIHFSAVPNVPSNPVIWKKIWNYRSLPKIDLFIWTLMHGSTLIGKNLERRGFIGPFCCPLCILREETSQHLFLNYSFTQNIWEIMACPWFGDLDLPPSIQ